MARGILGLVWVWSGLVRRMNATEKFSRVTLVSEQPISDTVSDPCLFVRGHSQSAIGRILLGVVGLGPSSPLRQETQTASGLPKEPGGTS